MNKAQGDEFVRVIQQIHAFYEEVGILSKKSPDGKLNEFKINFINQAISDINLILKDKKPFKNFDHFDLDKLPSNSDVTMILAQYLKSAAQYYAENTEMRYGDRYHTGEDKNIEIERLIFLERLNR